MENYSNNEKDSPAKFWQALVTNPALAGAAISGVGSLLGGLMGRGKRRKQQREAKAEYDKMRKSYEGLDTSNIYADVQNKYTGMENVYEDLTVNQQQAQFQAQQMSASIGQQEAQNQRLRQGEAGRLQTMERQGESQAEATRLAGQGQSRSLDWQKQSTLFGMSQQKLAGANQAISSANQAMWGGLGSIAGAVGGAAIGGKLDAKSNLGPLANDWSGEIRKPVMTAEQSASDYELYHGGN